MAHVKDVIAGIAPHDSQERFEGLGVTVIREAARFVDIETVEVGGNRIKARRFVVATGSSPSAPPIPGLDSVDYFTNETIFDNTTLPAHLIIIGGGPIGMEMAQAHRRLGAKVTVLEAFQPLGKDDPELTAIVLAHLRDEGIDIRAGAKITGIAKAARSKSIEITLQGEDGKAEKLAGSHLLVAAGRVANVGGLNLEAAGIEYDRRGIKVDKGLRSTNRKVYAIGDVAGGLQFTHVAGYQAGLVIRSILFRLPVTNETKIIPWVTYTDPELAHIGLTEAQAVESHPGHKVLRWHFAEKRSRPRRTPHIRPDQGGGVVKGRDPRLFYRGSQCRRPDSTVGNGDFIRTKDKGHDRHGRGISDLQRSFQTGCNKLLCRPAIQAHGSTDHRMAQDFWMTAVS